MSAEKNLTIEELEKAYYEAKVVYEDLQRAFDKKQKEEDEKKKAKLELEKEKRMAEIDEAIAHLNNLFKSYIVDYGYIKIESKADDYDWFPSFWRHNF